MKNEEFVFQILKEKFPDLVKNGFKKTIFEAMRHVGDHNSIEALNESWQKRYCSLTPDASRFEMKKFKYKDGSEKERVVVEFWEIENTHITTKDKLKKYELFSWQFLDPLENPFIEVWICNRFGTGHHRAFSDAVDVYGMEYA